MSSPQPTFVAALSTAETMHIPFDNTYVHLPERFYARVAPTPVANPRLIKVNEDLARFLRLDPAALKSQAGVEVLAGNRVTQGSQPLAMAYAGHQFGHLVPQLGDGRANLLGEVIAEDGERYDIQLKGSGPTPFSRRGDGRAALGPVLREYIVSEAMHALGVRTTRALAAVTTGQTVLREDVLPGAVLTRVAASHLRVGTFQYFALRGDVDALRTLAAYATARHYPEAGEAAKPYRALLEGVVRRQARLVNQWMLLGFIHGVMNTDNTSISGETIDYGPCAFLEAYEPGKVFSSIDLNSRYAYENQPAAMHWNLTRLAEAMLPLLQEEEGGGEQAAIASARAALDVFEGEYLDARLAGLRRKLGLTTARDEDGALAEDLLVRMAANRADFTLTFRRLCDAAESPEYDAQVRSLFVDPFAWDAWAEAWKSRLTYEIASPDERATTMRAANPAIIPRNHLVQAALQAAVERNDFTSFDELLGVMTQPYQQAPAYERYATPARPEECVQATFCGT